MDGFRRSWRRSYGCVEQHDREEEHHDGAGVNDDLNRGGKKAASSRDVDPDKLRRRSACRTLYTRFRCAMTSNEAITRPEEI